MDGGESPGIGPEPRSGSKPTRLSPGSSWPGFPMRSHSAFTTELTTCERGIDPMHQILLITAMTATSGLFGGGRHHAQAPCGRPTMGYSAPMYSHAPAYAPS